MTIDGTVTISLSEYESMKRRLDLYDDRAPFEPIRLKPGDHVRLEPQSVRINNVSADMEAAEHAWSEQINADMAQIRADRQTLRLVSLRERLKIARNNRDLARSNFHLNVAILDLMDDALTDLELESAGTARTG